MFKTTDRKLIGCLESKQKKLSRTLVDFLELETSEDFWRQGWQDPGQGPVLIDTRLAKHKVWKKNHLIFLQTVSFSV
jgi:hypothetical protein